MTIATDLFAKARSHDRLEQLQMAREQDLLPYFRLVEGQPGPVVEMDGRERITLGSNNYLGLTRRRARQAGRTGRARPLRHRTDRIAVHERHAAAPPRARARAGGLDGDRGRALVHDRLPGERRLHRDAARSPTDTVICDSGDHASILDAVSMSRARIRPFRHNRLDKLETMLERAESDGGGVLVVVDGVFSMEGDVAPLVDVVRLCREHGARLLVDEAHGVGVLGERGAGASEAFGVEADVDLRMGTFSKSLASCGGFIAGPAEVIDFLRVSSRAFMFTAAAVPAAVAAALEAVRITRSDEGRELLDRVLANARHLHAGLSELGFDVVAPTPMPDGSDLLTPIIPVVIGDDWRAVTFWKALYDEGVYTNVALYPAVPRGGALLRTSVMATHEREHLDRALDAFARVRDRLEAETPA